MLPFSIAQLEYIVAVDTHRHFVTAAEASHVTQPTLSMQIRKLEEQIGVEIFDRSKQPVIPTDVGVPIIAQARKILAAARELPEIIKQHQGIVSGSLRLGIIPTLSSYLLPRFIGGFTKAHPSVELHVQELETSQVVEALHKDLLDAGLIVTPLQERGIVERPLFYEKILPYAKGDFETGAELQVEDLLKGRLWMLSEGHCFRDQALNLCQLREQSALHQGFEFESGSLETLRRLVDVEGGVTLLPELAVMDLPKDCVERVHSFQKPHPMREVSLVHSRTFAKRRLLDLLVADLLEAIPLAQRLPGDSTIISWR